MGKAGADGFEFISSKKTQIFDDIVQNDQQIRNLLLPFERDLEKKLGHSFKLLNLRKVAAMIDIVLHILIRRLSMNNDSY